MKKFIVLIFCLPASFLYSNVIECLSPNWFASELQPSVDQPERFEFRIDTPAGPPSFRIKPKNFVIKNGCRYWIEPTATRPYEIIAQKNGELELSFPPVPYQYVGIMATAGNMLRQTTLENSISNKYGRAESDSTDSILFHKNDTRGLFTLTVESGIPVTPGKRYRLTYGYRYTMSQWGSHFYPRLSISNSKGQILTARDAAGFTPKRTSDQTWLDGYCFISVPSDWEDATLELTINSEGQKCNVQITALDIREAITPMRNHPRHHGTAQQFPAITNVKAVEKLLADSDVVRVKTVRYAERPVLEIDGKQEVFTAYSGGYGPTARMFKETGYPMNWCSIPLTAHYRYRKMAKSPVWLGLNEYDFSAVDKTLSELGRYIPGHPLMLVINLYPYLDFTKDFPEAKWTAEDGRNLEIEAHKGHYFHSITGKTYRQEVGKVLRLLGEHLKNSPWGRNIIGIHLADGGDGQWFNWLHADWQNFHFDHSADSLAEFRMLISELYDNDIEKLRKAWNSPEAEFAALEIPHSKEWEPYFNTLLDSENSVQRRLLDFAKISEDPLINSIDWLLKEFNEGLGRKVIGLVYFPHDSTAKLISSKHIDGIVSVPFYAGHRAPGNSNFIEQPAGSFRINDKFCLIEMDHRTDFSELGCRVGGYDWRGLGTAVGDRLINAQIIRDFATTLTQGEYSWICTIAGYNTWSEKYNRVISEYLRAAKATLENPRNDDWGQIAFIQDLKAKRSSGRPYGFAYNTNRIPRKSIMEAGVGLSDYLVEDIGNPRMEKYKIYLFADNVNMTSEQVEYIDKYLKKDGNILVFTFGTALNTPGGFEKNIQSLTGMTVHKDLNKQVLFQYAEKHSNDPLADGLDFVAVERGDKIPLFWVDDAEATALAWHESAPELVAAAVKRYDNWTAIYLANGYFTPHFPRTLAKETGQIPSGPLGDVTLAGNSLRVLHASSDGLKEIHWNGKANLIDLSNGQIVGYGVDSFKCRMKAGDTKWFKIVK